MALSEAELPPKPLALYDISTTGMGGAIANNASIGNITGTSSVTTLLGNMPMAERLVTEAILTTSQAILLGTMRLALGNMPKPQAVR